MRKFSIITVSYNSGKTIERTINSVIEQQYDNYEYIIIDGGSIDNTLQIIDKYRDSIDIIVSEKDDGISDAFNKGIKLASGDYILLLNSDDTLLPHSLNQVDFLLREETDVFHTNINLIDINGKIITTLKPNLDYEILVKRRMTLNHPGMFIKKDAYDKYGTYNTDYKCVMDRELVSRMYLKGAVFQYGDIVTVNFAIGGESSVNFIKHAIPEGRRISLKNGASPVMVYTYSFYRYVRTKAKQVKNYLGKP